MSHGAAYHTTPYHTLLRSSESGNCTYSPAIFLWTNEKPGAEHIACGLRPTIPRRMSTSHAATTTTIQRVVPLSSSRPSIDAAHLSPAMCFLRQQIQIFTATEEDVAERRRIGGTTKPPNVGRVGLRCKWCCDPSSSTTTNNNAASGGSGGSSTYLAPAERSKGAVTYPKSIRIVHQSVRNFQRYHFFSCAAIPDHVTEEFRRRQKQRGKQGGEKMGDARAAAMAMAGVTAKKVDGKDYWIVACRDRGMVDVIQVSYVVIYIRLRVRVPGCEL